MSAESRVEDMVRQAMASGFACIGERIGAGEVDLSAPLTEALGDYPAEFIRIRAALFDGLFVTPEQEAQLRHAGAERELVDVTRAIRAHHQQWEDDDSLSEDYFRGHVDAEQIVGDHLSALRARGEQS